MQQSQNGSFRHIAILTWLAWALLLAAGLSVRIVGDAGLSSIETELKAGSTLALAAFAWLRFVATLPKNRSTACLIAVGISLGCLGDASPLLGSLWPDPQRTLVNMLFFGVGHVCYILAFVSRHKAENGKRSSALYGSIASWLIIGVVVWYLSAYTGTRHSVMRVPALGYTLLLSATAGTAVGYALVNRSFIPVALGAILFLISDVLLGVWIFHDLVYRPFDLVWITYGVGQMLIVYGVLGINGAKKKHNANPPVRRSQATKTVG